MNLFGARVDEIVGIANHVARDLNAREAWVKKTSVDWRGEGNIAGIRIRLNFHFQGARGRYLSTPPSMFSILGNGWMMAFQMKRTARSLSEDIETAKVEMILPNYPARYQDGDSVSFFIYSPSVVSPDAFQRDMTLLRLFSSEWE